jgi:hypothetical protein
MKPISGVNGRINEGLSEIGDLNEEEGQRNNQFSKSSVVMVRSAEIVEDVGAETLQPLISKKVTAGSIICSDTWKAYTGIASRGYVHRLVNHGEKQYSDGKGNHINGLEGFWGYLKRKLVSKGGIRREKLPL